MHWFDGSIPTYCRCHWLDLILVSQLNALIILLIDGACIHLMLLSLAVVTWISCIYDICMEVVCSLVLPLFRLFSNLSIALNALSSSTHWALPSHGISLMSLIYVCNLRTQPASVCLEQLETSSRAWRSSLHCVIAGWSLIGCLLMLDVTCLKLMTRISLSIRDQGLRVFPVLKLTILHILRFLITIPSHSYWLMLYPQVYCLREVHLVLKTVNLRWRWQTCSSFVSQSARSVISNVIVDFNVLISVISVKIAVLVFLFGILKVVLMHLCMSSKIGLAACAA